ncbi:MAG: hypothetical protein DMF51_10120 [Acidobacteria bacterium]|nr:MAG: hypothetical protein DMF51_10120 [Acidobacteriota bacterium]
MGPAVVPPREEGVLGHPEESAGRAAGARGGAVSARPPGFAAALLAVAGLIAGPIGAAPADAAQPAAAERPVADVVRDADAAFARQDFKKARPLYEEAVRRQPDQVHALIRAAMLESWDSDLTPAADNYRRALALAPGDFDARLGLARVLSWKHEFSESIGIYRTLREEHPDDPKVLLGLGQTLSWAGRFREADEVFASMEEHRIEPIQAHIGRARLRGWQGRLDEAAHYWRDVLRADPGNLDARIGLAYVHHWQGLDRSARAQADGIVLDHPDSKDAKELQATIHLGLRPHADADAFRYSDTDSNRVDAATGAYVFMAEPQTSVRIAYSTYDASFRCEDPAFCNEPGLAVGDEIDTRAQMLTAGATSRLLGPLTFSAHAGAVREETFGGPSRLDGVFGGFLRWQVGPRFAVGTSGGWDMLLDTAPLIDRGIRTFSADARLEYRFRPAWLLSGGGGVATYSDGNGRKTAAAALEWRAARTHPWFSALLDARYRTFNADRNDGYFDPLRYDSELLTLAIWDDYHDARFYWRAEGTYGRQAFTVGAAAPRDDRVKGASALAGINFAAGRGALEASYTRSDYALNVANGFKYSRTGLFFRYRF